MRTVEEVRKFITEKLAGAGDTRYYRTALNSVLVFMDSEPPCEHIYAIGFEVGKDLLPYQITQYPDRENESGYFVFKFCPYCGEQLVRGET